MSEFIAMGHPARWGNGSPPLQESTLPGIQGLNNNEPVGAPSILLRSPSSSPSTSCSLQNDDLAARAQKAQQWRVTAEQAQGELKSVKMLLEDSRHAENLLRQV